MIQTLGIYREVKKLFLKVKNSKTLLGKDVAKKLSWNVRVPSLGTTLKHLAKYQEPNIQTSNDLRNIPRHHAQEPNIAPSVRTNNQLKSSTIDANEKGDNSKVNEGSEEVPIESGMLQGDNYRVDKNFTEGEDTSVPVYVVEEHHEALPYWFQAVKDKRIANHGNILIHIDGHSDLATPTYTKEMPFFRYPKTVKEEYSLASGNDMFIVAAAMSGLIDTVVYIYPSWDTVTTPIPFNEDENGIRSGILGFGIYTGNSADQLNSGHQLCTCVMDDVDKNKQNLCMFIGKDGDGVEVYNENICEIKKRIRGYQIKELLAAKLIYSIYKQHEEKANVESLHNTGIPGDKVGQHVDANGVKSMGDIKGSERNGVQGVVKEFIQDNKGYEKDPETKNELDDQKQHIGSKLILDIDEDYFGVEIPGGVLNQTGADMKSLQQLSDIIGELVCDVGSRHDESQANAALRGITGHLLGNCRQYGGGGGGINGERLNKKEEHYEDESDRKLCKLELVKQAVSLARAKIESLGLSCGDRKDENVANNTEVGIKYNGAGKQVMNKSKQNKVSDKTIKDGQGRNINDIPGTMRQYTKKQEQKLNRRPNRQKRHLVPEIDMNEVDNEVRGNNFNNGAEQFPGENSRHNINEDGTRGEEIRAGKVQFEDEIIEDENEIKAKNEDVEGTKQVIPSQDKLWSSFAETIATFQLRHLRELHSFGWCAKVPIRMAHSTSVRLCLGLNDPDDTNLPTFTPTETDIRKRESRLTRIISSINKVNRPGLITLARSVKDGYTPRSLAGKVEKAVLRSIEATAAKVVTHYDAYLWGGVKGWQDRNAKI